MQNKEVSDALHTLLHCALKDTEFETQKEQFTLIYDYIKKLENNWNELESFIENSIYNSWYLYRLHTICQYEDGIRAQAYENVRHTMSSIQEGE